MGSLRESDCAHPPHMPFLPVSLDMLFIPHTRTRERDMIRKGEGGDTLLIHCFVKVGERTSEASLLSVRVPVDII
jgi:hypothetical protein